MYAAIQIKPDIGIKAELARYDDGFILNAYAEEDFCGTICVRFRHDGLSGENILIPAVWYQGNMDGEGAFPSLRKAPCWSFTETRMPLPGIIGALTDKYWSFIWLDDCGDKSMLASCGWDDEDIIFRFPSHESPYSYRGKTKLEKEEPMDLRLEKGSSIRRIFHVFHSREKDPFKAYRKLISRCFPEHVALKAGWNEYASSKLLHLLSMIAMTDDGNAALIMGRGNGRHQRVYEFTAGSFLVKSLEAAASFLHTSENLTGDVKGKIAELSGIFNDEALFPNGLANRIGQYFLSSETADGFYQDSIDLQTGERGGYLGIGEHPEYRYLMNSRCAGEAMAAYIELYRMTGRNEYLSIAKRVLSFFAEHQLEDGSFGRWWDRDGSAIDRKGTNGAYIGVAMAKLIPVLDTGNEIFLASVEKAMDYYSGLSLSGSFHGDTLDADSVDKEAGVSILSFMLECIEGGYGGGREIEAAEEAASFILTWIWQGKAYLPEESPLGRMDFSTEGMTSVSAAHHHLDFYGMLIAYLFFRLERIDGDKLWGNQGRKMMNACLSLIGTESNDYLGRDRSFDGWQPEQINHTSWDYFSDEGNMNGTWSIDIAWVNVLGYSSFLAIKRDFPELFSHGNPEED